MNYTELTDPIDRAVYAWEASQELAPYDHNLSKMWLDMCIANLEKYFESPDYNARRNIEVKLPPADNWLNDSYDEMCRRGNTEMMEYYLRVMDQEIDQLRQGL